MRADGGLWLERLVGAQNASENFGLEDLGKQGNSAKWQRSVFSLFAKVVY
jgi:hypothetical protein